MEIYVGTYEGQVTILETDSVNMRIVRQLPLSEVFGEIIENSIKSMCSIDNRYLVVGGFDQEVRVIDLDSYQEKVEAKENVGQITTIAEISPKSFVIGIADGTVRLWNTNNWTISKEARFHKKSISSIVLANNSKILITSAGNKIILWNALNLKKAHEYKLEKETIIEHLQISDDMKWIYYCTDKGEIWRIETEGNERSVVLKLPANRKIQVFIWYQNFLVIANDVGEVFALRVGKEGEEKKTLNFENRIEFKAHNSRIKAMKIIEGYLIVATASGEISLWDFPMFLEEVDEVSKTYLLEGLEPLCKTQIKGRVLCLEGIVKGEKHETEEIEGNEVLEEVEEKVEEEIENHETRKEKKKSLKKKKIEQQQQREKVQHHSTHQHGSPQNKVKKEKKNLEKKEEKSFTESNKNSLNKTKKIKK